MLRTVLIAALILTGIGCTRLRRIDGVPTEIRTNSKNLPLNIFKLPPLPARNASEEWFGRLRVILWGTFEAVLLMLAMITVIAVAWDHALALLARAAPPAASPSSEVKTTPLNQFRDGYKEK
jgi:hypothetical protein